MAEYYYYASSNDQDYNYNYPVNNYTYYNQPHIEHHHHNSYSYYSSSYDYGYGGYSNEQPVRYDHYYNTQIHGNPYQHLPTQSLTVYHHNSAYDNPEFAFKKGSESPDLGSTTGFVVSYSNTEPQTDLEFEEYNPEPYRGGYNMTETYGKPLPPSEEICYPPSKIDPTPPPASPFGKGEKIAEIPAVKEEGKVEQDQDSELDEEDDEKEEYDEEEEEEEDEEQAPRKEEENRGILIAPPLPWKEEESIDKGDSKPANESHVREEPTEEHKQSSKPKQDEEEEEKEEEDGGDLDVGRDQEKEIRRQVPPGYGLEALDLCEGVFGGYFPCLSKKYNQVGVDQSSSGSNTTSSGNGDPTRDCWKSTMDYLFGDPDPYARAMPDPIYGYQRYYPQQPLYRQVEYGGEHACTWSDNPSCYGYYNYNGGYQ